MVRMINYGRRPILSNTQNEREGIPFSKQGAIMSNDFSCSLAWKKGCPLSRLRHAANMGDFTFPLFKPDMHSFLAVS